ncbi:MAG: CDP-alcohol phosphatidyltransferase family protein [bacterium]|nr:CDP-alcohol phosphatidyltransferase family protein [bacterium]MDO5462379.1 CDP-alcohol phosphatidyltransferase family protein [bacterium]
MTEGKKIPANKVIVNSITSGALVCGLLSTMFSASGNFYLGAVLILGAMILDGLDGTFARLLKAESQFGAEFDTFVDITAFGVAPAMLVYFYLFHQLVPAAAMIHTVGAMLSVAIVLSGALRLARFKVVDDDHGMSGYTGMPITVNALCLAGIILFIEAWKKGWGVDYPLPEWVNLQKGWLAWVMYANCIICLLLQISPFKYPKPTNTPIGQFIGVLAFVGLFIGPKTAVISCCYLVPMTLFYIYLAPFWFKIKNCLCKKKVA